MSNRRDFIKALGISGVALTVPAVVASAPVIVKDNADITNLTLKGSVQSNGRGIADVPVTDGLNITLTDKNGNYLLLSNKTVKFIYITIPAGYAIPHNNGIAMFYKEVETKQGSFTANFQLDRLEKDDKDHVFVVWADPQIISKKDGDALIARSAPDLRELAANYPAGTLIHAVGCGDLVWDHFELYDDYRQAVGMTGVPFFNVIGNHDMDLDARSDDYSAATFKNNFGPTYYSFNRGSIHYVMLDDVFFIGAAKRYIGYLTETQLQWLEQDLKHVPHGSTVVLSTHIPTNTGAKRRNKDKEDELGGVVSNREQLYKILSSYKVHIMSGHTHMNEKWESGNMMEHVHGTICGAWWTGPICSDGTPEGYAVYEVKGNDLSWFYKSTGKPRDYQLKIYPKGYVKSAPDELAVNVWNWDKQWKVQWFEDGLLKGDMVQRTEFDPWSVELYAGDQLPKKHKFVEPTLTDHLFFAKPSVSAKAVKVVATDRFGKHYTQEIQL